MPDCRGPTGTWKTKAEKILAHHLKQARYGIDMVGVVSKYIGETEKNLAHLFQEDETSFFDEANALFGKRTEVREGHDRYANIWQTTPRSTFSRL